MPVSLAHVPSYRKHAASGQARVTIDGRDFYLGFYNSAISRERYDRLIAEWIAAGRRLPCTTAELSVKALILAFMTFAEGYYRTPAGEVAAEYDSYRVILGPLRRLYGESNAAEFGPLALKAVREAMIAIGWARTSINRHISRVRRVFRWGAENELVPPNVHSALAAVDALRRGRSSAKESEPVRPVEDWVIEKTLGKVVPPDSVLKTQFNSDLYGVIRSRTIDAVLRDAKIEERVKRELSRLNTKSKSAIQFLERQVRKALKSNPKLPWTAPIQHLAAKLASGNLK